MGKYKKKNRKNQKLERRKNEKNDEETEPLESEKMDKNKKNKTENQELERRKNEKNDEEREPLVSEKMGKDKKNKGKNQKLERKKYGKIDKKRKPLVARNQADKLFKSAASHHPNLSGMKDGVDTDRQGACARSPSHKIDLKPKYDNERRNDQKSSDRDAECTNYETPSGKWSIVQKNKNFYSRSKLNDNETRIEYLKQQNLSKVERLYKRAALQSMKPPENFRLLPTLPSTDDLFRDAFLRPNIVKGKYCNTEHYLDVQYRLLREDYVRSLRDAVTQYLSLKEEGKPVANITNAKVYENVRIVQQEFVNGTMHHLVQLSVRTWESDKCLRLGSLLCLSSDDFKTLLFASVAHRDPRQLNKGPLLIHFEDEELNIGTSEHFVMIETSAYFEAYRHNLKALQELHADALPLKEYIVDVKTYVKHPRYLHPSTTYDMRPLLVPMYSVTADGELKIPHEFSDSDVKKSVKILDDSNWPSASDLNLEISQYRAVKAALTREFTIIQGPPGTGKTYVGLRIVQLLLHNKDKWFREDTNSIPILVVCATNHALDQFLEGILPFTDEIVRIGNQGKNEVVSEFQLFNLKRKSIHRLPVSISSALCHQKEQIDRVETNIAKLNSFLQKCTKHVLSEEELSSCIPVNQYRSLKNDKCLYRITDNGFVVIYDWLGICPTLSSNCFHSPSKVTDEVVHQVVNSQHDLFNKSKALEKEEASKISNVWHLDMAQRWSLYKYWLENLVAKIQKEHLMLQAQLKTLHGELSKTKAAENLHIIKRAHVVGMTTTGAAKHRQVVRSVNPQILIVEEAAQIQESHIVTALAPNTQHMILIGDHRQLRPAPNIHELTVDYDANISLFERMIKNKMDYFTLSVQHRMRSDIKDLISPHIYRVLENHPSVEKYEDVKGVGKNVYFVTHKCSEMDEKNSKSKINTHEATFMIRLCNYLVQQGYDASQVTVLTTYNGQLSVMKKMVEEFPSIKDVKFTVVDNYQGKENDIILLSFVRSNDDGDIGFLKIPNRVCVALSRAKKGLYCIGDFELFAEKSNLWKNVTQTLKQKGAIGQSLELWCQNHPNVRNKVSMANDFESVRDGGCTIKCNYSLPCGHVCSLNCHPYDHSNVSCLEKCNRKCENGHECALKCYEKCQCEVLVDYKFPLCAHTRQVLCYSKRSPDLKYQCEVLVDYKITQCGHTRQVPCYSKWFPDLKCDVKCERQLICGHECPKKCGEKCAELCKEIVLIRSKICGHDIEIECHNKHRPKTCAKCCKSASEFLQRPSQCAKNCLPCQLPCENRCIR